jgi:hypothetical protein
MKFYTSAALALTIGSAAGIRTQETKKIPKSERRLEEQCELVPNHDAIQSGEEIMVNVQAFPQQKKTGKYRDYWTGEGLFEIEVCDEPWAPAGTCVKNAGWCIDFTRVIETKTYSMDLFSIYDEDLMEYGGDAAKYDHNIIVDKPEKLPNLAWLINNINVGDVVKKGDFPEDPQCQGTIRMVELQGGIWRTVDFEHGLEKNEDGSYVDGMAWYYAKRNDCLSKYIAWRANTEGNNYEVDCDDPNEEIPIVYVVDAADAEGNGEGQVIQAQVIISETKVSSLPGLCACKTEPPTMAPTEPQVAMRAPPKDASSSGDPHFRTWNGDKFDYHGECDLTLIHNPSFAADLGLYIHIRTTRVQYFSYIEEIAIRMGNNTLEFTNDVSNFKIDGEPVAPIQRWVDTKFAGFVVRRDPKAISIRLDSDTGAKIDLIQRNNGFPAVVLNGGEDHELFEGSLGLLGDWATGKRLARDGKTEMYDSEDATAFALEWQVRDTDPQLFSTARFPQWPTQCTPPKKMMGNRLGLSHMTKQAEEACKHWKTDMDDCIFDVIATRDVLVAAEGSVSMSV